MNSATIAHTRTDPALRDIDRRELYFFNLWRVLQAVIITGLMFSPWVTDWLKLDHPALGRIDGLVYLLLSGYALRRTE